MAPARRLSLLACVIPLAALASMLSPQAAAAEQTHMLTGSFGSEGAQAGQFRLAAAVAVDEVAPGYEGDVYVLDAQNDRIEWFDPEGVYRGEFNGAETPAGSFAFSRPESGTLYSTGSIAIDDSTNLLDPSRGDVYVDDLEHDVVDKFEPDGKYLSTISADSEGPYEEALFGVAVDSEGHLYVATDGHATNQQVIEKFSDERVNLPTGEDVENPSLEGQPVVFPGLAVDPGGDLYDGALKASSDGEAIINDLRKPGHSNSPTGDAVDEETGQGFIDVGNEVFVVGPDAECTAVTPCERLPEAAVRETFGTFGMTTGAGLAVTKAGVAYVSTGSGDQVDIYAPTSSPAIEAESTEAGAEEASVSAEIDPLGEEAGYRIEYGPSDAYGASTSESSLPADSEYLPASQRIASLAPHTEYHYRFVAHSSAGTTYGRDQVLRTSFAGSGGPGLPDGRVDELVSSPSSNNDVYPQLGPQRARPDETRLLMRAAADGEAVTYVGDPPPEEGSGATGADSGNQYLALRGADGWSQQALMPSAGFHYEDFSPNLETGVLNSLFFGISNPLIPAATPGAPTACGHQAVYSYTPADRRYHSLLSEVPEGFSAGSCAAEIAGGNAGTGIVSPFTDILFQSEQRFTPEAGTPPHEGGNYRYNLYDSDEGQTRLVSVLPDGIPSQDALFVGTPPSEVGAIDSDETDGEADSSQNGMPEDISADGSRVFWAQITGGKLETERQLYVRENPNALQSPLHGGRCTVAADACTVQIDVAQPGAEGPSGGGQFRAASADGSKVFFTDANRLTPGSGASAGEPDLYEYLVNPETGAAGTLLDLTPQGGADVQGVIGVSADGQSVYFAADGVLPSEPNAEGDRPIAGQPNMYLDADGTITLVATLTHEDGLARYTEGEQFAGDWASDPGMLTAEVSPDGQHLVFRSTQPLTGYANEGLPEVFVYDATGGRVACASCAPSGQSPVIGLPGEEHLEPGIASGIGWSGALLPPSENSDFIRRWMSANGARIFFESSQALSPQDHNGMLDVYEWERPAEAGEASNTCSTAAPNYSAVNAGCVSLLTTGTSTDDSYLLDASENGNDVFVLTRARLSTEAPGEYLALYDARVDGGFPELKLSCTGTGCQGVPPAAPSYATPASVTFSGSGNYSPTKPATTSSKPPSRAEKLAKALKACLAKHNKRKRQTCEVAARRRDGKHQTKTSKQQTRKSTQRRKHS
jgi:hypothetical protein